MAGNNNAFWRTAVSSVRPNEIRVRGYDLIELIGSRPFGDVVYLLLSGDLPKGNQGRMVRRRTHPRGRRGFKVSRSHACPHPQPRLSLGNHLACSAKILGGTGEILRGWQLAPDEDIFETLTL